MMRFPCRLREIRGDTSLREIERLSGIHRGTLSLIERGRLLPLDVHVPALERAYGAAVEDWFGNDPQARRTLLALEPDPSEEVNAAA